MRIALFTETFLPKVDGIVTRLCHTIDCLQRSGDQVLVVAPEGGIREYCGAAVHGVTGLPLPLYPELKLALPSPTLGAVLSRFQPDLIHAVNPAVLGVAGLLHAKLMQLPLVASYHTHLPQYLQYYGLGLLEGVLWELLKAGHNQAHLNLCTSTAMMAELQTNGIERVALWQRGVDTERFHPQRAAAAVREQLSQGDLERPLLLYVGRLSAEKELEQLKPILEAIPEARLALVGDGPHRGALEQHFAGTPTYFAGYWQGTDLAAAFASADAFVLPSRTETLGLVLLEAMAAGCPVVAARSGGIVDIVTDGANGYLFDPGQPRDAIAATRRLLYGETEGEQLRANARREAERWSWQAATQGLRDRYRQVLAQAAPASPLA
ncbi:MAG: glycosyl transferase [Cyanobacteria bacterium QS_8_64_29]|nr:MAG: glycosyl transferase [Cyanobacteria bacterium QS_8_64_29]